MTHRQGEEVRTHFRSERYFTENGKWYFMTRENPVNGPYTSKKEAEAELTLYIRHAMEFPHEMESIARVV